MSKNVIGVLYGDPAGVGPEVTAKALPSYYSKCVYVLIGDKKVFVENIEKFAPELADKVVDADSYVSFDDENKIYIFDVAIEGECPIGKLSAPAGKNMIDTMIKACDLKKAGKIDGILLGPLTKASIHKADPSFNEEATLFEQQFGASGVGAFVKCKHVLRATCTGHCAFKDILNQLTTERIVNTGLALFDMQKIFGKDHLGMAVAAINPHAGEDGLFGDEEARVIEPAIKKLNELLPVEVTGAFPCDTMLQKCIKGRVGSCLYMFHDQGNLAIKSWAFDDGVTCFVKLPCPITSPGHGSSMSHAGKGDANHHNTVRAIEDLMEFIDYDKTHDKLWEYSLGK